jgi:hypothetical protein
MGRLACFMSVFLVQLSVRCALYRHAMNICDHLEEREQQTIPPSTSSASLVLFTLDPSNISLSLSISLTTSAHPSTARWLVKIIPPYFSDNWPLLSISLTSCKFWTCLRCSSTGTKMGWNGRSVDLELEKYSRYASWGVERVLRRMTGMGVGGIVDGSRLVLDRN